MKNKNPKLQTIIIFNNFAISNQFSKNTKKYKIKIVPSFTQNTFIILFY